MSSQDVPTARPGRRGPRRLRLATVAGVPVLLSPSWLVIAAVITFLFSGTAASATGLPTGPAAYAVAFVLAVLLAVSVLLHEAAHAVAARRLGLHVSEIVVDLWGGHTALGRPQTPGASAVVSVVGPLANLALALVAWVLREQMPSTVPGSPAAVVSFLLLGTAVSNALVGVFNLVPGLPLDGGRVLEALVWRVSGDQDTGGLVAGWAGRVVAVGLGVAVLAPPLLAGDRPSTVTVLWVGLVAVFLWRGASASIVGSRFRRRAARVDLGGVTTDAVVVPVGASVAELDRYLDRHRHGHPDGHPDGHLDSRGDHHPDRDLDGHAGGVRDVVLVDDRGRPVAVVTAGSVAAVPDDLRATTPATALARLLPPGSVVPASGGARGAVEGLARSGDLGIVVVDDLGRPTGRVTPGAFAAAMGLQ